MPIDRWKHLIDPIADELGVYRPLAYSVMDQESAGDPNARSHAGAMGLMQLMPQTAKDYGAGDPWDPEQNIRAGLTLLRENLERRYKDAPDDPGLAIRLAMADYNAGPTTVNKRYDATDPLTWEQHPNYGIPWRGQRAERQKETVDYVNRIYNERLPKYMEGYEDPAAPAAPAAPAGEVSAVETYTLQLPDYTTVEVPNDIPEDKALDMARERWPDIWERYVPTGEAPVAVPQEDENANVFEAFYGGLRQSLKGIPGGASFLYSLATEDPERFDEAVETAKEARRKGEEIAPDLLGLEDIQKAYRDGGATEALAKIIELVGEQTAHSFGFLGPAIGAGIGGRAVGTAIGAVLGGPAGAIIGGNLGQYSAFLGTQVANYSSLNLDRAYNEGKVNLEDYTLAKSSLTAGGQAALDLVTGHIAFPGIVKRRIADGGIRNIFAQSVDDVITTLERQTPIRRTIEAMIGEGTAEIGQQALERFHAGLEVSPANAEAANEYATAFLMAIGPGGLVGGAGAAYQGYKRRVAIAEEEGWQKTDQDRFEGAKALQKLREDKTAKDLELDAQIDEEETLHARARLAVDAVPTVKDIHAAAESRNIPYDNDLAFMAFTRRLTGKAHLDELSDGEIEQVYNRLSAMPVQDVPTRLQIVSNTEAIDVADNLRKEGKGLTVNRLKEELKIRDPELTDEFVDELSEAYTRRMYALKLLERESDDVVDWGDKNFNLGKLSAYDRDYTEQQYQDVLHEFRTSGVFPELGRLTELTGIRSERARVQMHDHMSDRGDITELPIPMERDEGGRFVERIPGDVSEFVYYSKAAKRFPLLDANGNVVKRFSSENLARKQGAKRANSERVFTLQSEGADPQVFETRDEANNAETILKDSIKAAASERARQQGLNVPQQRLAGSRAVAAANINIDSTPPAYTVGDAETGFDILERRRGAEGRLSKPKPAGFYATKEEAETKIEELRASRVGGEAIRGRIPAGQTPEEAQDIRDLREEVGAGWDPGKSRIPDVPVPEVTPEQSDFAQRLSEILGKALRDIGLKDYAVSVEGDVSEGSLGSFDAIERLIRLANSAELAELGESEADLARAREILRPVMNHEMFHIFSRRGWIKLKEWNRLIKYAKTKKLTPEFREHFNGQAGRDVIPESDVGKKSFYNFAKDVYGDSADRKFWIDQDYIEEAVAFAAQAWSLNPTNHSQMANGIFGKIARFLKKVSQALRGQGFTSADEIFEGLYGDTMTQRIAANRVLDPWYARRPPMLVETPRLDEAGNVVRDADGNVVMDREIGGGQATLSETLGGIDLQRAIAGDRTIPTPDRREARLDRRFQVSDRATEEQIAEYRAMPQVEADAARKLQDKLKSLTKAREKVATLRSRQENWAQLNLSEGQEFGDRQYEHIGENIRNAEEEVIRIESEAAGMTQIPGAIHNYELSSNVLGWNEPVIEDLVDVREAKIGVPDEDELREVVAKSIRWSPLVQYIEKELVKLGVSDSDRGTPVYSDRVDSALASMGMRREDWSKSFHALPRLPRMTSADWSSIQEGEQASPGGRRFHVAFPGSSAKVRGENASMARDGLTVEADIDALNRIRDKMVDDAFNSNEWVDRRAIERISRENERAFPPSEFRPRPGGGWFFDGVHGSQRLTGSEAGTLNEVVNTGRARGWTDVDDVPSVRPVTSEFSWTSGGLHVGSERSARERLEAVRETYLGISRTDANAVPDWNWSKRVYKDQDPNRPFRNVIPVTVELVNPIGTPSNPISDNLQGQITSNKASIDQAKADGNDGIIYLNDVEDKGSLSVVAFNPHRQIKVRDGFNTDRRRAALKKDIDETDFSARPARRLDGSAPHPQNDIRWATWEDPKPKNADDMVPRPGAEKGEPGWQYWGDLPIEPNSRGRMKVGVWEGRHEEGDPDNILKAAGDRQDIGAFGSARPSKGYGRAHMDTHNKLLSDNTPFQTWEEALEYFLAHLDELPKRMTSGDVYSYGNRTAMSLLWDDSSFGRPIMFALDKIDPGTVVTRGTSEETQLWSLTTMFADDRWDRGLRGQAKRKGSARGKGDAQKYERFRDPGRARRFVEGMQEREAGRVGSGHGTTDRRFAGTFSTVSRSPARKEAIRQILGPIPISPQTFIQRIASAFPVIDKYWFRQKRQAWMDAFESARKQEMELAAKHPHMNKNQALSLAHNSAHSAAMMYNRAGLLFSAALRFGQISYKEGITAVDPIELTNTGMVKFYDADTDQIVEREVTIPGLYDDGETGGFIGMISPIANPGNNMVPDLIAYKMALRGHRIDKQGKGIPFDKEKAIEAMKIVDDHPEIGIVQANLDRWNSMLVDFLVDTGVLDAKMAQVWKDYADYIPFYLNLDGETTEAIDGIMRSQLDRPEDFQIINSLVGPKTHPRYLGRKGRKQYVLKDSSGNIVSTHLTEESAKERRTSMSDDGSGYTIDTETVSDIMDPIEAIAKNTMAAITTGLANVASSRMIRDSLILETANEVTKPTPYSVTIRENGVDKHYEVSDLLLHQSLTGAFEGNNPVVEALGGPVRLLREMVTKNPGYMGANMLRDSLLTWVLSGVKFVPFTRTLKNFGSELREWRRGTTSETYKKMQMGASIGGYELMGSKKGPKSLKHVFTRGVGPNPNRLSGLFGKIWEGAGEVSAISEASTRMILFEETYAERVKELGDRRAFGEANRAAIEILDFNRRGNSPYAKFWMMTIPFMNSRLQGTDVMARTLSGHYNPQGMSREQVRNSMLLRGGLISFGTMLYAFLNYDDPEFEEAAKKGPLREDNWWLKLPGTDYWWTIPIPFEAGVVFKIIPEQIVRTLMGQESRDTVDAVRHALFSVMNFNPVPHAVRPMVETWMNKSMFTGEPIVPHYMEKMGGMASRPTTGRIPKLIGETLDVSPLYLENLVRGYLGTLGTYALTATDYAVSAIPGTGARPMPKISDVPFFDRFVRHELGGGRANAYYDWREEVEKVVQEVNHLKEESPQDARKHLQENVETYRMNTLKNALDRSMSLLRKQRNNIMRSDLGAVEMSEKLDDNRRRVSDLLRNIEAHRAMSDLPSRWLPWQ